MHVSGANLMVTEAIVSQKLSHVPLLQCVCVRLLRTSVDVMSARRVGISC